MIAISNYVAAQENSGLVFNYGEAYDGYTLFSPMNSTTTYLIDTSGYVISSWPSEYQPGMTAYLLDNGHLLRTSNIDLSLNSTFAIGGSAGGMIQEFDIYGNVVWEYLYSAETYHQHHDIEPMPNGNVLILAYTSKTRDEAIDAGVESGKVSDHPFVLDHIVEIEKLGANDAEIIWEWHAWDHLIQHFDSTKANYGIVEDHPEKISLDYYSGRLELTHANSIDYHPELDQILISIHAFDEIWIIDHSTTTEEAASDSGGRYGKGGDILYRWGNPAAYKNETPEGRTLIKQHDARWITEEYGKDNILIFNNGGQLRDYSTIIEMRPTIEEDGSYYYLPANEQKDQVVWEYFAPDSISFYAQNISGAMRLPNGNTFICAGPAGRFFEINQDNEIVWEYKNPYYESNLASGPRRFQVARAEKYSLDHPGIQIIINSVTNVTEENNHPIEYTLSQNYPNPFNPVTHILFSVPHSGHTVMKVYDILGKEVDILLNRHIEAGMHEVFWDARGMSSGIYFYTLTSEGTRITKRMLLLK
ncbi:aryl-sulfate sulfotransferase [candidate division KSB1 bacterium]